MTEKVELKESEQLQCFCSPSQNGNQCLSDQALPVKSEKIYEGSPEHNATFFMFISGVCT